MGMNIDAGEKGADERTLGGRRETLRGNLHRSIESREVPIGAIGGAGRRCGSSKCPRRASDR